MPSAGSSLTRPKQLSNLCGNSVLDLAVDGTELLVEGLLGILDDAADTVLDSVLDSAASLVATASKDLGVVGGTTTVPGEEL